MELAAWAIGAVIALIMCIPLFLTYIAVYVLEGIAFTKLSKIKPVKNMCLVWIPSYVEYIGKKYIMSQFSDEADYHIFGRSIVFKNRLTPFWIYFVLQIVILAMSLIVSLLGAIPILGIILFVIYLVISVPSMVVLTIIEYGYFRDMLNYFRPGNTGNVTTAVLVTIANIVTNRLVGAIYLIVLSKKASNVVVLDAEEEI
ncbi:MAG: hypothetical protein IKT46_04925 [Clostridia bacterium]|nr:hypothetical protein [Clostridia bacterium]